MFPRCLSGKIVIRGMQNSSKIGNGAEISCILCGQSSPADTKGEEQTTMYLNCSVSKSSRTSRTFPVNSQFIFLSTSRCGTGVPSACSSGELPIFRINKTCHSRDRNVLNNQTDFFLRNFDVATSRVFPCTRAITTGSDYASREDDPSSQVSSLQRVGSRRVGVNLT